MWSSDDSLLLVDVDLGSSLPVGVDSAFSLLVGVDLDSSLLAAVGLASLVVVDEEDFLSGTTVEVAEEEPEAPGNDSRGFPATDYKQSLDPITHIHFS